MNFAEAFHYLLSLGHETLAIKLGLDNITRLLDALRHPQHAFPCVQIAGTNGKGSVAAMLEHSARAAGIKTGLYTSPHLVSITERIRINGQEISPDRFALIASEIRAAAEVVQKKTGALPTFFEQVTAIALVAFREANIELAILETGLGGRLDATTAAQAAIAAITPIALDHQEYLGQTIGEIAAEKAAIIRPGVTRAACLAPQSPAVEALLAQRCRAAQVTPRLATPNIKFEGLCAGAQHPPVAGVARRHLEEAGRLRLSFNTRADVYENVCLALRGRHQATNAALAIELAETLNEQGFAISRAAIMEGLESAVHPGRLEMQTATTPAWLFDGAHNVAGAQALRAFLDEFIQAPITLIFGAMRDKALSEMAAILFPAAQKIILTQPDDTPRGATHDELLRARPSSFALDKITHAASVGEALRLADEQTSPEGLICVTGSLYLIGEVKRVRLITSKS